MNEKGQVVVLIVTGFSYIGKLRKCTTDFIELDDALIITRAEKDTQSQLTFLRMEGRNIQIINPSNATVRPVEDQSKMESYERAVAQLFHNIAIPPTIIPAGSH